MRDFDAKKNEQDQLKAAMSNLSLEQQRKQKKEIAAPGPNPKAVFIKQWDEPADVNPPQVIMKALESLKELSFTSSNVRHSRVNAGVEAAKIAIELFDTD